MREGGENLKESIIRRVYEAVKQANQSLTYEEIVKKTGLDIESVRKASEVLLKRKWLVVGVHRLIDPVVEVYSKNHLDIDDVLKRENRARMELMRGSNR